jgi:hypothetical protein
MANPDISSLFGEQTSENNSILGNSVSSLMGGSSTSSLLSQLSGNSSGQLFSETMMMPIYSNYIGKNVEATDSATNKTTSGKVESVLLQNGLAMLNVGGSIVDPSTVTKVE